MANSQAAFGLQHIGYLGGGSPDYQLSTRAISRTNATPIGFGDPVQRISTATPYITVATTTALPIEGVFYGCTYVPPGGATPVFSRGWPGATAAVDATAYIVDAPNAIFLAATLLTAITSTSLGALVGISTATPNTTGAMNSQATLDQSTLTTVIGTTTTAGGWPFRVIQLYQGVGNGSDPTTNYNWVVVGFNNQINRLWMGT